jgi:HD superfamily phosphohydrolase YqeK
MINKIINRMIEFNKSDARRISHALKVYAFAHNMAVNEGLQDTFVIDVSSVLHDIGITVCEKKYNSAAGIYQELEGARVARMLLADLEIEDDRLEKILFYIGNHHTYNATKDIEFQILIEADLIVNAHEEKLDLYKIQEIKDKTFKTRVGKKLIDTVFGL